MQRMRVIAHPLIFCAICATINLTLAAAAVDIEPTTRHRYSYFQQVLGGASKNLTCKWRVS